MSEIDDILNMSDEEILADVRAQGLDPEVEAAKARALFEQAVKMVNAVRAERERCARIADRYAQDMKTLSGHERQVAAWIAREIRRPDE